MQVVCKRIIFVTFRSTCIELSSEVVQTVPADIVLDPDRMLIRRTRHMRQILHDAHAAQSRCQCVVIRSADTDGADLACAFSINIPSSIRFFSLPIGTKARTRYVDNHAVSVSFGNLSTMHYRAHIQ